MEEASPFDAALDGRAFAVIGAGVVGLSLARRLARRGGDVILLESRKTGGGASGASAGVLQTPKGNRSLLQRLTLGAQAGYGPFVDELSRETGEAIEFRRCGLVELAVTEAEEADLRKGLAALASAGIPAAWMGRGGLEELAPGIAPRVRGGLHFPGTAWVHPPDLLRALRRSAEFLGVRILEGRRASLAPSTAGKGWDVLAGGIGGERIDGREVIVTAGAWTGEVLASAGLAPAAPIVPVRGQMAELSHPAPPASILHHGRTYVIPRPSGTVWVGATVEEVGFDEGVVPGAVEALVEEARAFLPDLGAIRRSWAGLRPKLLRRGGPLLGEGAPPVIAGHYRSGIHLGPITAHMVASRIAGDPVPRVFPFEFGAFPAR